MADIFSINTIFFTLWGYQMSYLEFFGTVFNLWCVWLAVKNKILTWPVGLVGIVLYVFLFYQIQLYSDLFEQFYFLIASFYGWWLWMYSGNRNEPDKNKKLKISANSARTNIIYAAIILFGTVLTGYFMSHINIYFPKLFPLPASFPYLDAFTTVMSFAATILMAKKKLECWYLWVLVDIIGVGLYYTKGVKFIALEYLIFLILATSGYFKWIKEKSFIKKGLVLGKFAPLHKGHQYLIETALSRMDKVYVMIYDCPDMTSIPLKKRANWIRKIYPKAHVLEVPSGPSDSRGNPEIMRQHEEFIRANLPEPITHFFSSEWYGDYISKALGAENVLVDMDRKKFPVSGTMVRSDPHKYKNFLHPLVYKDFVIKVVFLGAESTGKTTLAREMANIYQTEWMFEYGREYWEKHNVGGKLSLEQLVELAKIHLEKEEELLFKANKYFFIDTSAITTEMFSRFYHGKSHSELERIAKENERRYDLYFVCGTDIPYAEDGTRSGAEHREVFQRQIIEDLNRRGLAFVYLEGTLKERIRKVKEIL